MSFVSVNTHQASYRAYLRRLPCLSQRQPTSYSEPCLWGYHRFEGYSVSNVPAQTPTQRRHFATVSQDSIISGEQTNTVPEVNSPTTASFCDNGKVIFMTSITGKVKMMQSIVVCTRIVAKKKLASLNGHRGFVMLLSQYA